MRRFLLYSIIVFISISCEKDNKENITGTWVVTSYEDLISNSVIEKSDTESWNGMDIILTFESEFFSGRNTTNQVQGTYVLNADSIRILSYGGTKIGQPEWGNMFSSAVHSFEKYTISRNQLKFYYNSGSKSVTFGRK
jgi:hypothetical protein